MDGEESIPLNVGGETLNARIRRGKHQKHIRIRISGTGRITVSAPASTPLREIRKGVAAREGWISAHLGKIRSDIRETDPLDSLFLRGERVPVEYRVLPDRKRNSIAFDPERGRVLFTGPEGTERERLSGLRRWLEREAARELKALAEETARELSIPVRKVFIRNQRGRWGSSSAGGNISINWRVYMLPPKVQRYLVIHELCHQLHLNHSKQYWKTVERHCPEYRALDRALRDNRRLMALFRED